MKKRTLQIDVLGPTKDDERIIKCVLIVDGRSCIFYTSRANYHALIFDGIFIRDGKEADSAGIVNTTHVFDERDF